MTVELEIINEGFQPNPSYAHTGDAGLDLRSDDSAIVRSGEVQPVDTGLRIAVPNGYVGLIHPRSGLSSRGIGVANSPGTIDSGYRGPLKVLVHNFSEEDFRIQPGDRIAQLVIVPIPTVKIVEVRKFTEEETVRGTGGFGSSGAN